MVACTLPTTNVRSTEVSGAKQARTGFAVSTQCRSLQAKSPQTETTVQSIQFAKGNVQSPIPFVSEARKTRRMSTPLQRGSFPFDGGGTVQPVRTESMAELPMWKTSGMKASDFATPCSESDSRDLHDSPIPTPTVPFWKPEVPSYLMEQLLLQMV